MRESGSSDSLRFEWELVTAIWRRMRPIRSAIVRRSVLLAVVAAPVLTTSWSASAGSSYLAVWSSDKGKDDNLRSTDFLAIIDADPRSRTYGRVVNTALLQQVPGRNLLNDLGLTGPLGLTAKYDLPVTGIRSNELNEAHHMSHEPITVGRHRYLYLGGLISANVFRCDVADPLNIPVCPLVTTAKDVKSFSGIDDFIQIPNGNLLVTYMGAKNLTTPGGIVELGLDGSVVAEYRAAKAGGPARYMPSVNGVTDTGVLAHPHGIDVRPDLNLVVTSDYADPLSLATTTSVGGSSGDYGTTVRFWKLSNLKAGPTAISQLPVGQGRERLRSNNAPEGVMSIGLTHLRRHKGVFAATMGGGTIWYAPDATVAKPEFRMVYRVGPGAAAAVFSITPDDRYLIQPIQGTWSPGNASMTATTRASIPAASWFSTSRSSWRRDERQVRGATRRDRWQRFHPAHPSAQQWCGRLPGCHGRDQSRLARQFRHPWRTALSRLQP